MTQAEHSADYVRSRSSSVAGIGPPPKAPPSGRRRPSPGELARFFHDTYERLAPDFGYSTRPESRVAWDDLPGKNRALMIATAAEVLAHLDGEACGE